MPSEVLNSSKKKEDIAMEVTVSPLFENLPKREVEESTDATDISGGEEHEDCYEIDFIDDDGEEEDDYCYVIDHSNHREEYVFSHCEVLADDGYDNGDEDEYDDSDFVDDDDDDDDGDDDDDEEDADDSDDDNCIEIVPTEFSQKISIQVSDYALAT